MEKRLVTAVLVSIVFIAILQWAAPKLFPDYAKSKPAVTSTATTTSTTAGNQPAVTTSSTAASPSVASPTTTSVSPAPVPVAAAVITPPAAPITPVGATALQFVTVDTPNYTARFSNRGAELVSFLLKHYTNHDGSRVELVKAREPQRTDFPFAFSTADPALAPRLNSALYAVDDTNQGSVRIVTFRYAGGGVSATKTFRFTEEYLFSFSAQVTPGRNVRIELGPGIRTLEKEESDSRFVITGNGVVQVSDSLKSINREKAKFAAYDDVQFVGIEDNYFLSALKPEHAGAAVVRGVDFPSTDKPTADKKEKRRDLYAGLNLAADGTASGAAFFGPKQTSILDRYGFERALQFGTFGIIARFFLVCLLWINKYTHNYGWAIIVLTIFIKIALYPLQHKWMASMKKMQKLQPKMDAIKARYKKAKTDPEQKQKMNTEMMKLYQQEGINPAGGCIPMLIQFPIFIGFYNLLSHAIELRGQDWIFWIHDLSIKDPYYILPLLMTVAMFVQQVITPTTADPAQRRTFLFMPLIFGWIFKEFPSGLVLYWLVQNVLTIVQQLIMNKWKDPSDGNIVKA
jgi:YidC/Oxa1 family membrane protein insertase